MPATNAYPSGALVPRDRKRPEIRAETDSTKMSGPRAAGEERTPPATATASTATLIPAASHIRAGLRREGAPAATGPDSQRIIGPLAASSWPLSPITVPPWLTMGPGTAPHRALGGNSR